MAPNFFEILLLNFFVSITSFPPPFFFFFFFFLGILATRTKSQIASIAIIFEKKYGLSLLEQVVSDMTTLLGKLITGKETGLGNDVIDTKNLTIKIRKN